ncbi:hypothetical protein Y032_0069g342 [Ancylostoma ceylanicum]|uniref:protein O-GlcNAcase n=1 Tax=Ancylostoma ceylanicum TaxID=53326 RepID=A0A016TYJ9_9BILA|nr:hypothetical protein Y032_0069g342 [Ancylostoma ceylanicum]
MHSESPTLAKNSSLQHNSRDFSSKGTRPEFICGVVEGFYGRPWTLEQRKHLFARLNRLDLNTYVYAPKDDLKHRPQWRIPYNDEEAEILKSLIESAKTNNITFVYSLSPGIDIVYSKIEERICIKSKLDQVRMLGCESFALLFDDIECEMNETDRQHFSSFVAAQVDVTNEVYEYLGRPQFFFCPTEYCESRAVPCLEESEYLLTLGKDLVKDVHILWTGPRVISRHITVEHARSVAKVIGRKPLIWDNLHANDYDQKRVFMGDFSGRPVALKKEIAGLLMNPSCKYELNFVPIHTYADWNASDEDAPFTDLVNDEEDSSAVDTPRTARIYHPLRSLKKAIKLWVDEFNCASNRTVPPLPRTDSRVDPPDSTCEPSLVVDQNASQDSSSQLEDFLKSVVIPSPKFQPIEDEPTLNSLTADYGEPMETSVQATKKEEIAADVVDNSVDSSDVVMAELDGIRPADFNEISMLVDMFYLPFECGRRAMDLLEQFSWLYENALAMNGAHMPEQVLATTQDEWRRRFSILQNLIQTVNNVFKYIVDCPNKPLVSELIPYIWDAHGSCAVLLGIARWMSEGFVTIRPDEQPRSWTSDREDEPWMIGGGFLSECSKIIAPQGPLMNLFANRALLPLSIVNYLIRPYTSDDLDTLATLSITSVEKPNNSYALQKEAFLDRFILPFLETYPQHCFLAQEFVASGDIKLISAVSAHRDARTLFAQMPEYISSLKEKYRRREDCKIEPCEIDKWFPIVPEDVLEVYPAWLDARLLVDAYDAVPTKKLVQTVASTLYINGCRSGSDRDAFTLTAEWVSADFLWTVSAIQAALEYLWRSQ